MTPTPEEKTTARDHLALVRTDLANERTLLAYLRTGLALLVGALTMRQLLTDPVLLNAALVLGALGFVALSVGVYRFNVTRNRMRPPMS